MSEHSDEKMRSVLREKLFRVDISADDLKWEDIESRVPSSRPAKIYYWVGGVAASVLIMVAVIFSDFNSQKISESTPQVASRPNVEQQITDPKTRDSKAVESEKKEQIQSRPESSPVAEDINIKESGSKQGAKAEKSVNAENLSSTLQDYNELARNLFEESSFEPITVRLQLGSRDARMNGVRASLSGFKGDRGSVTASPVTERLTSSLISHLSIGVRPIMKYGFIKPKRTDYIFLEKFQPPPGLSTERLGAHIFISIDTRLSDKWYLSTGGSFAFQRYALAYRFTDLIGRQTTSENLSSIERSLGGQLGLKRLIKRNNVIETYLTVSTEYQKPLGENVNLTNDRLVLSAGYEIRRQLNQFLSFSLEPTVSYSFSDVESKLFHFKPYWVGVRLSVNRNFLKY